MSHDLPLLQILRVIFHPTSLLEKENWGPFWVLINVVKVPILGHWWPNYLQIKQSYEITKKI